MTTGTGYLRSKGWVMKTSFEKRIGNALALKALQDYIRRLDKKHGNKAFKYFTKGDKQILLASYQKGKQ